MYKTEKEISAGAVVYRHREETFQVILFSRRNGLLWSLPKGKIERNEMMQDAAIREVKEETGAEGKIITHLNDIHYWYVDKKRGLRLNKTVHFFLMEYGAGQVGGGDSEVESVEWFDIDLAIKKATYESERQTLKKTKNFLESKKDLK